MVTIKDIAEETGLSPATVARALGDNGPARPETRAKVREAAERLGYVASSAARSMRRQSSNMLGLVVPDIANRFYSEMARIMAAACDARGLHFLLAVTDDDPMRELQQMRAMVAARVAAVALVPGPDTRPELKALASRQPFTQLVRRSRELPTDWFGFDEEEGLRLATEHLLDLGHRHILLACSADRYSTGGARQKGFREAYARRGMAVDADLIRTGAPTVPSGRAAVADIPSHVTAIIAAGTMLTEGAADALSRSGRQIPDDISFVGFGLERWHTWWHGGMTRIVPPVDSLAAASAEHLLARIGQFGSDPLPELVERSYRSILSVGQTTRSPASETG
jgi:DNA-binding LacI/PurR family transcriptional regulator